MNEVGVLLAGGPFVRQEFMELVGPVGDDVFEIGKDIQAVAFG